MGLGFVGLAERCRLPLTGTLQLLHQRRKPLDLGLQHRDPPIALLTAQTRRFLHNADL